MKKLKIQKNIKINIKNIYLNNQNLNTKKQLYEYIFLLHLYNFHVFELKNKNIFLPTVFTTKKTILTIEQTYNNSNLFNYNINYKILFNFHNIIIKNTLILYNKKYIKIFFIITEKKNIKNIKTFLKYQVQQNKNEQKKKCFFIIFGYIFSIKYFQNIYINIKNKKFFLFNMIKKKKSTFFEKKKFNTYLLHEDFLKHQNLCLKYNKKRYLLSRIQYLISYINKPKILIGK